MIALLLNHLWQSSLCVGGAGLIVLALSRNSAHVRFWLWFAASMKFLIPFAVLTALGAYALGPLVPPVAVPTVTLMEPLAKPFSSPAMVPAATRLTLEPSADPAHFAPPARSAPPAYPTSHPGLGSALLALWLAGVLMLATRWLVRWLRVRAVLRDAIEAQVDAPVAVKFSASRLEPGLVGILHPVILLPQGIERQLSPAELRAVLAHELCHWRRHDNLLAAIHMLVEALFWFFPLVWWLGARLNAERECACDESVLAGGNDPQIYAEGILKVCRAYLQSPLACVAGVSGADLKKRIETIMENRLIQQLNAARRLVLSASAAVALAVPLALGLMTAPATLTQAKAAPLPLPNARRSAEQTLPLAAGISPAVLPANQAAESPVGGQTRQTKEAATTSTNVPSPAASPQLLPDPASGSDAAAASNDPPAAPIQQSIQQGAIVPPATVVALNDQPAASRAAPGTCTLPAVADQVALEQLAGTDLVTVPVAINGTPKHFLLDIGTNPTEVSQPTVAQLGLPENYKPGETIGARNTNMAGLAFGNDLAALTNGGLGNVSVRDVRDNLGPGVSESRVRIAAFTVGRATGRNMLFLVANDARMGKSQSEPYDGLLTGSFFKQYDVELDFAGKQINWLTPTRCADPNQVVFWPHSAVGEIPMTIADGKIQVPVMIQGHQINAVMDTSSAHTVMRRDIAELILGLRGSDMAPDGDLKDGKGAPVYLHTFPEISFAGGVTANNVPTLILTSSLTHEINSELVLGSWARSADARVPDLTLGMDVLHQLHMYVVPGQGKVYVTAAE
jgi:beta-lactamase regulating signal transducer with metallopeptidase domain